MRKICLLLISIFLASCTNTLEKSVLTPLTDSELKSTIEKDPDFEETHELIVNARRFVVSHDYQSERYKELTYSRAHKLYTLYKDPSFMSHIAKDQRGRSKEMENALKQNDLLAFNFLSSVSR